MSHYRETPPLRRELGLLVVLALVLYPFASFAARGRRPLSGLVVLALCVGGALVIRALPRLAARLASRLLVPVTPGTGRARAPSLSLATAHEARGEVADALETVELLLRTGGLEVPERFEAAELLARQGRHVRAAEVLQALRALPRLGEGDRVRATSRLADLYLGPLADRDRAVRELRRLAHAHPGSAAAAGAERLAAALLAELRAERACELEGRGTGA